MSNNKQSSVDFIYESLRKYVRYDDRSAVEIFDKIFADAKARHKEESVEFAFKVGRGQDYDDKEVRELAEIIYNETFGE